MFHNKLFFVLILFTFFTKVGAQNFELGKVSIAEIEEKVHPKDSSAVAAILYKKAKTLFNYNIINGFTVLHEYEYRIKIYKKEGLSWANFEVPYYVGYEDMNKDMVKFSNGVTYNLENGTVVKTKLNSEGSFKENLNDYWNQASITLPNVKVGSVIEFKYTLRSENIVKFPVFNIQYDIPVNYTEYRTEIPGFYLYKTISVGYVNVVSDSKLVNGYKNYEDEHNQTRRLGFKQVNSIYTAQNVPALIEEDYVDNLKNYRSAIRHELETVSFPEQPVKDYSVTWEGVAKTIYKDKNFGKELDERTYIEQDVMAILKDAVTPKEKLDLIFKFVQNKMNWNGDYGYYTDKGVKKAYLDRTGNIAEINFILIAMLKRAGINVSPVLTSTLQHGVPTYPSRTDFNYVIAAVQIDDKQILLDATNKFNSPNILPLQVLNWTGRLIRQDGSSEEINLVPTVPSKKNNILLLDIESTGKIKGKLRILRTDYEALSFREKNTKVNQENYLEKLENDLNNIEISDYAIENISTDLSKPVVETITFATANQFEIIADKMFINPLLFYTMNKNPFVQETRQMPVYFMYPKQEKYAINFDIPNGYTVESIPKAVLISTPDNVAVFTMDVNRLENKIQISITREINRALVTADFYNILKDYFKKMIEKQNEKIILTKI
nr:DUF3857 domain-containing protein [uncultured Flavobacterium sp.]